MGLLGLSLANFTDMFQVIAWYCSKSCYTTRCCELSHYSYHYRCPHN